MISGINFHHHGTCIHTHTCTYIPSLVEPRMGKRKLYDSLCYQELWTEEICCPSPSSDTFSRQWISNFLSDAPCVCPTLSIHFCSCEQCSSTSCQSDSSKLSSQELGEHELLNTSSTSSKLALLPPTMPAATILFTGSLQHSDWPAFELDTNSL